MWDLSHTQHLSSRIVLAYNCAINTYLYKYMAGLDWCTLLEMLMYLLISLWISLKGIILHIYASDFHLFRTKSSSFFSTYDQRKWVTLILQLLMWRCHGCFIDVVCQSHLLGMNIAIKFWSLVFPAAPCAPSRHWAVCYHLRYAAWQITQSSLWSDFYQSQGLLFYCLYLAIFRTFNLHPHQEGAQWHIHTHPALYLGSFPWWSLV